MLRLYYDKLFTTVYQGIESILSIIITIWKMVSIYNDERSIEAKMIAVDVVDIVMTIWHVR